MDEHMWEEDRYTPEGIPMTAPTNAGMKGAQNWRYERERTNEEEGIPSSLYCNEC